jgi:phage repressor protein C with HTH and peptisase S24 domain
VAGRRRVERTALRLPRRPARYREAAVITTIGAAVPLARVAGCAALLDLAAAAGTGREMWDDPCETWLELPPDIPPGRHVAIHVEGDSMEPVLSSGDVIVIKLDAVPVVNDLVVARRPNSGFVVKRLAAITPRQIELASLNPAYPPFRMRRGSASILGTVVARFSRNP